MFDINSPTGAKIEQIYVINDKSTLSLNFVEQVTSHLADINEVPEGEFDPTQIINGVDFLTLETLNIIKNKNPKELKTLNKEKLCTILKCLGLNIIYCPQITDKIFKDLNTLLNHKTKGIESTNLIKTAMLIKESDFYKIIKHIIKRVTGAEDRVDKYFHLSYHIINKTIPLVILLGGTSGTGKSTLSSLLASRLGISSVISTDTIRHILRNFLPKDKYSVLFSSTYEAWKQLEIKEELSNNKIIIKGYSEQCKLVAEKLEKVIDNVINRNESIIIEGVHLTVDLIRSIMKKHKFTFPFFLYIEKAEKHKERFAVRSKLMTLDARFNKYVENFDHIRTIQSYLIKKGDRFLLPKIDNTNVDKSIGMIQETILRSFKDIYINNIRMYDKNNDNLSNYFNNFSKLTKNLLSSKEANILISQKVNKNFLFEKFFSTLDDNKESFKRTDFCPVKQENKNKLPNKSNKKECLSDDEVIVKLSLNKERENKIEEQKSQTESSNSNTRLNYQLENFNRSQSRKLIKVLSTSKPSTKKIKIKAEIEERENSINSSVIKIGSIDSESFCERIKVINETDDEVEDFNPDVNSKEVSCGSISEEEEEEGKII